MPGLLLTIESPSLDRSNGSDPDTSAQALKVYSSGRSYVVSPVGLPGPSVAADWRRLPHELWLSILVDYGLSGRDLVRLDLTCRWFGSCWGGRSVQWPNICRRLCAAWLDSGFDFIMCSYLDRVSCGVIIIIKS